MIDDKEKKLDELSEDELLSASGGGDIETISAVCMPSDGSDPQANPLYGAPTN
ncbi:MAG: hypothetical protein LBJ95_03815 [Oscillospiraceae bacterium]|jgi:hypothetical protein|nr:hypothetical protein [Oscillospiraceae bacterium]